jgi:hypothetical protein
VNYKAYYDRLILKARSRTELLGYSERHHVTPKCLGGGDEPFNLVNLTPEEHYVAHQLLVKMNPEHLGISYAAMLMSRVGKGKGRVNNKRYSWLKTRYSVLQSQKMANEMIGNTLRSGVHHDENSKQKISDSLKKFWEECSDAASSQSERAKSMWENSSPETKKRMTGNAKGKRSGQALENIRAAQRKRWAK